MTQDTYLARKGYDADFANITASGTLDVTGALNAGSVSIANITGVTATAAEINAAADISTRVEVVTVTGTVTPHVQSVELDHVDTAIAATIADAADHAGLFVVKDTSATGTESHTLTLTAGTFNGTNNVATLDARDEMLIVYFDSTGRGQVIVNVGTVVLS